MRIGSIIICFILPLLVFSQKTEVANEAGSVLFTNADIHPITSDAFNGDIFIEDGKIKGIGELSALSIGADTTIDCSKKSIYPGFIDGGTHIGLKEIGSISLTQDDNEYGKFNSQLQAIKAVNPNTVHIPINRASGLALTLTRPSGGIISGKAAAIRLFGYTPEQMLIGMQPIVLNFPQKSSRHKGKKIKVEKSEELYRKEIKKLTEFLKEAKLYKNLKSNDSTAVKYAPRLANMKSSIERKTPVFVDVSLAYQAIDAMKWAEENDIDIVLTSCDECWRVADSISKADVPVIYGPVLSTPTRSYDAYDSKYTAVSKLHNAGVKVALQTMETANARNLPFHAGFAATYGLDTEEALKLITVNAAEILQIDDKYGSLEEGKSATFFISDGDPFEPGTDIEQLYIDGWHIPLVNRQSLLYKEFNKRKP